MTFNPSVKRVSSSKSMINMGIHLHISNDHWMKMADFYTTWTPGGEIYFALKTQIEWWNIRSAQFGISTEIIAEEICAQLTWSNRIII